MRVRKLRTCPVRLFAVAFLLVAQGEAQQQISNFDRGIAQDMLKTVAEDVQKHYYDPKMHGLDWDAEVTEAKRRIDKTDSWNMALSEIAALLDTLHDSHTLFFPPLRGQRYDYGWQYQMIGDHCFVTRVRPKSDAEAKGVKPGDEILTLNGYRPTRGNLWKMQYLSSVLQPQPALRLNAQDPAGNQRQLDVAAEIREGQGYGIFAGGGDLWDRERRKENLELLLHLRDAEFGDQLMVLKVPEFFFSTSKMAEMIGKARRYPALILDLRGNPGGTIDNLEYLVGSMFDKEVKIGERIGRKESKAEVARAGDHPFPGKLVVLVDSKSGSAAELFARVVQIEKRGVVIGDHTSGSVMEAIRYTESSGIGRVVFFGVSVSQGNLVMSDGKSLEHTGVTPDEIVLPDAKDLENGRDPVMARAAELLGVKVSAEEAGKLFPYEWLPQ
jgi:C-terminal processing protease CtpA/Prc